MIRADSGVFEDLFVGFLLLSFEFFRRDVFFVVVELLFQRRVLFLVAVPAVCFQRIELFLYIGELFSVSLVLIPRFLEGVD